MHSSDPEKTAFKDSARNFHYFCQNLSPLIYDFNSPKKTPQTPFEFSLAKDLCSSKNPFEFSGYFTRRSAKESLKPYQNVREIQEFNPEFEEISVLSFSKAPNLNSLAQQPSFQPQTVKKASKNVSFLAYHDLNPLAKLSNSPIKFLDEEPSKPNTLIKLTKSPSNFFNILESLNSSKKIFENPFETNSNPFFETSFEKSMPFSYNKPSEKKEKEGLLKCNCSRTQCLKLYCECFSRGNLCGLLCKCEKCQNNEENMNRTHIMKNIAAKNPLAFQPKNEFLKKIAMINQIKSAKLKEKGLDFVSRGCRCRKSFCSKRYCECFINKIKCTSFCKCQGCKNRESLKTNQIPLRNQQKYSENFLTNEIKFKKEENSQNSQEENSKKRRFFEVFMMKKEAFDEMKTECLKNKRVHAMSFNEDFLGNTRLLSDLDGYLKLLD